MSRAASTVARSDFISRDDSYSPPKTVELVRKLVEQDGVLALFQTFGTAPNSAIREYLNDNKVPQLFVRTSTGQWNDPSTTRGLSVAAA